jgi:hypothetical protein
VTASAGTWIQSRFLDIDAISLGEDFVEAIETTVAKCDVLIAVIGKNWLL